MTRATTLADVATLADVSAKTVSRVVNGDPNVSAGTKAKVEEAIERTGFRPNLAARSLAAARSFLIGTFAAEMSTFYYAELYRGAARACRRYGYHLVVEEFAHIDGVSATDSVAEVYARTMSHIVYDGLVLPPPISDDRALLDLLDERGVRYVRLAPATKPERSSAVFSDDATGVRALVSHLWSLGHRRFGIASGPRGHAATVERRDAFIAAVDSMGGEPADVRIEPIAYAGSMIECGRNAADTLLVGYDRPTAIFAFNDEVAAGIIIAARERGLECPRDLSVAGFDDSDAARLTWPPLTTIRQPIRAMGEAAVEALVTSPSRSPVQLRLAVELMVRESTGPERKEVGNG